MTVIELINELENLPDDAEVYYWAHGSFRKVEGFSFEPSEGKYGEVCLKEDKS
ncbi:MAG: hypothetical protein G3W58_22860 [Pantoea ananatis]|nr:hypothetical protein [Pantoea ananatis]